MASGLALYVDRVCIGVYALMSQHASAYVSALSQLSAGGAGQRGAMLDLGPTPDSVQFLSVPSQSSGGPSSVVGPIHHPTGRALSGASDLSATSWRVRFGGRFVLPLPCPGDWFLPSTLPRKTGLTAFAAVVWSSVSHALPGSWRALLAVGLSPSAFGPNVGFISTFS